MQRFLTKAFNGHVKDSKLMLHRPAELRAHLQELEGQEIRLTVEKAKKVRSSKENRYYWGVVLKLISDDTGTPEDDVHNHLKIMFLRTGGDKIPITRSTTELSTVEMEEYLRKCRMWASADLNIYIPEPNEIDQNYNY